MSVRRFLPFFAVFVVAGQARADVIPPGQKSAVHYARFENLGDYPDYVFFITHGPHSRQLNRDKADPRFLNDAQRLDPADAVTGLTRNPILGGIYLLAAPKSIVDQAEGRALWEWLDGKTPGVLQASIGSGYRSVPESEKRSEYWTHYRVDINDGAMALTRTRDDKPGDGKGADDAAGLPSHDTIRWYIGGGLAVFAVVLLVGWIVYFRRK